MGDMNAADDDDDGCSSPAETLPYTPLSPSEDDDDDGKKTADCLINAAYNCYTQMHKPKNALIYAILFIAGKCMMCLFVYLFTYLYAYFAHMRNVQK